MKESGHSENVFAYRITDKKVIHISEVEKKDRGRGPGYYCLGCERRLQAVLTEIDNRMIFFRHDAEAVKGQPKCTYSDETYRHKLAKDILQIQKKIKVPNLYKYSFDKENPRKYLIKESHYVEAAQVLNEHYIYEDEKGEIQYSRNKEIETGKALFIKPDVIFLDTTGKPILIIELVATHKPDKNKLIKLKRLGINAVEVRIPKDSPEAIELAFKITNNTFWIYNYEEDSADPVPVSNTHTERVFESDLVQRAFFEENFTCRSAQIRNLIRQIERILESEYYRGIVEAFRSEIQRTAENARTNQQRLADLRKKFRDRGIKQHSSRREELSTSQRAFQIYIEDLEERYHSKARELESEENSLEQDIAEIEFQEEELNSRGTSARKTIEGQENAIIRIRGEIEELPGIYRNKQTDLERQIELVGRKAESIEQATRAVQSNIERAPNTLESKEKDIERDIDSERQRLEAEITRVTREIEDLESEEGSVEATIAAEYPADREEYTRRIEEGSYERSKWFNSEHAALRELADSIGVYCTLEKELTLLEEKNRNRTKN